MRQSWFSIPITSTGWIQRFWLSCASRPQPENHPVQAHGGGITVCTEPGTGTTFEVLLPLSAREIEKQHNTSNHDEDHGTENILFVDDEAAITKLGEIFLGQAGYNITAVSDGQMALQIFAADPERFDLVVTDQTMPNMTGETLTYELLKIRSDIPIILCSGHIEAVCSGSSKANGTSRFLYKPVTPKEMRPSSTRSLGSSKGKLGPAPSHTTVLTS